MKKMTEFVSALLIGCVLLTGCGSKTGEQASDAAASDSQTAADTNNDTSVQEVSDSITGRIESIDTSASTVTIASMPQGGGDAMGGAPSGGGEAPDSMGGGNPPDGNGGMPDGMGNGQGAPEMSANAETTTITITDSTIITDENGAAISLGDLTIGAMITIGTDNSGNAITVSLSVMEGGFGGGAPGGMGGGQGAPDEYDAVSEYSADTDISGESFASTGVDENAILVQNQARVSLDNVTIDRTSSDSTGGDSSSFYGIGAAALVTDGYLGISDSTITTDAAGGAGVFAYGSGVAEVSDTIITTTQNTSGGIHVAGGGTLNASNLTIETSGESAAAIRSDRGGGTMTVNGGSYTSNGLGSPAVYCTADITIENAALTATGSEAVCIEGLNSLCLTDCDLSGNMSDLEQNDCTWTVILYQSMSGDSELGNSTFDMRGGSLTSENGGLFYTTNTESTFYISDVDITYSDDNSFFLKCTGNSNQRGWGQSGANGADCTFTASKQEMAGNIVWDSISTLEFVMSEQSILTGAFIQDESNVTTTGNGCANLTIEEGSKWIVTGDSILSALVCNGTIEDSDGNSVTIVDADGNVLFEGTSQFTITVSSYKN